MPYRKLSTKLILSWVATIILAIGSGVYIGISLSSRSYETEILGWNTIHTGIYLTSLEYLRNGEEDEGLRLLELSLDMGERIVESRLEQGNIEGMVSSEANDTLRRYEEYRKTHPFSESKYEPL